MVSMKVFAILIIMGLGLLISAIFRYFKLRKIIESKSYTGKLCFNSHGDYAKFKHEIASEKVILNSVSVLSSEPPIVVQFSVNTPPEYDFPYGAVHLISKFCSDLFLIFAFPFGGALFVVGVWFLIRELIS